MIASILPGERKVRRPVVRFGKIEAINRGTCLMPHLHLYAVVQMRYPPTPVPAGESVDALRTQLHRGICRRAPTHHAILPLDCQRPQCRAVGIRRRGLAPRMRSPPWHSHVPPAHAPASPLCNQSVRIGVYPFGVSLRSWIWSRRLVSAPAPPGGWVAGPSRTADAADVGTFPA
jgi:hypothetical protein